MKAKTINNTQKVFNHIYKTGKSITPLEALGVYGIYRLAPRIHELRKLGIDVKTTYKTDNYGKRYASYSLS